MRTILALPHLSTLTLGLLAATACGGVEGDFDPQLDPIDEFETTTSALSEYTAPCVTGIAFNGGRNLGPSTNFLTRTSVFANDPLCRATTYVEWDGGNTLDYKFWINPTFIVANAAACIQSTATLRVEKSLGGGNFSTVYNVTVPGTYVNGSCFANLAFVVSGANRSPIGDYRVRANAVRFGGFFETITVYGKHNWP
ncbi:MAG: hypothetical protein IPG45_11320 [Deltaproteobacteria bacterium]|jgi:hypothetical protein|nr:hypothetical protein [Deltaproteobacteria bacterium]